MTIRSRKVFVEGKGGPEVLRIRLKEAQLPRRNQVRIRVHRAGVAFGDVMRRRGVLAPPWAFTPGYDVVGIVEALGPSARKATKGARVAAFLPGPGFGGYADHVVVEEERLVMIPDEVTDDVAIALGLNYITARQLIHRVAQLSPDGSALVHGAAGGLGTALLDLGGMHGLRLFGTASRRKHAHLVERGCHPIDYQSQDFVERIRVITEGGVDAVFDGIGGPHLARSYQALGPRGILVSLGVSGDMTNSVSALFKAGVCIAQLKLTRDKKRTRAYAIGWSRGCSPADCRRDWQALLEMSRARSFVPLIGAVVPLDEVREAHRLMDEAAVRGKVVLSCE